MRVARSLFRRRVTLGDAGAMDAAESPAATPEEALARWQLVQRVHAAIASLEPEQREVLILRDLEGASGDEVAARLGLSEAAMKSRLHRARRSIRAFLEACDVRE